LATFCHGREYLRIGMFKRLWTDPLP